MIKPAIRPPLGESAANFRERSMASWSGYGILVFRDSLRACALCDHVLHTMRSVQPRQRHPRAPVGQPRRPRLRDQLTFLDEVDQHWPEGKFHVVWENLSTHKALGVLLWLWEHPRCAPFSACLRSLVESYRVPVGNTQESCCARQQIPWHRGFECRHRRGTDYWNDHRHPYTCRNWGRMAIVDTKPFKLRVILHRIFVERPQVTGIPAWPGGAACYRRSRYIL